MLTRSQNILKILEKGRSTFLFGARGTGKTSLLVETLSQWPSTVRIDLLHGEAFQRYASRPELLRAELSAILNSTTHPLTWVAIDEVQKLPSLLDEVHSLIETYKGRLAFLLTGSSARKLRRGGANLLAGRALTRYLHPLSSMETPLDLLRALRFGTLPAIYLDTQSLEISTLEAYVSTYLREEIQAEALVRQVDRFARFLELAAQLNGEPINFAKLGRQCGVTTKTTQEYFSILVDTLICMRLDGWSQSVKRQLLQAPKFYFFDCGVVSALTGELRSEPKPASFRFGRLFETFLIQEMQRRSDYLDLGLRFNYWRDKDGHEVDIVVSRTTAKPLVAIEIKSGSQPLAEDLTSLALIAAEYPGLKLWCLCTTPRAYELGPIAVLPWLEGLHRLAEL